jgi:hypothetical protein
MKISQKIEWFGQVDDMPGLFRARHSSLAAADAGQFCPDGDA